MVLSLNARSPDSVSRTVTRAKRQKEVEPQIQVQPRIDAHNAVQKGGVGAY